jgi:chorismate lyase / 3-hydroxybenzoate synthase
MRAHMRPLEPEYATDARIGDDVLGLIRFGTVTAQDGGALTIAMPPHGGAKVELWRSSEPVVRGCRDNIAFARNGSALFGMMVSAERDIEKAAKRAYESIVAVTRAEGFPFLLRAWNHMRDINAGDGDQERYKRFSAGRHDALTAAGLSTCRFPSASAVGMRDGELAIYFIASRVAGRQVENPRQVSAYHYPREYGPRPPSFARATALSMNGNALVFISGTASVVGHETRHAGDVDRQTEETIRNLERIVSESGMAPGEVRTLKLYVRRAADSERINRRIRQSFPGAAMLVLEAELCRRDLLLEVEAVAIRREVALV